jgi:hypothetical protein
MKKRDWEIEFVEREEEEEEERESERLNLMI